VLWRDTKKGAHGSAPDITRANADDKHQFFSEAKALQHVDRKTSPVHCFTSHTTSLPRGLKLAQELYMEPWD
jgi:hypothetical protein